MKRTGKRLIGWFLAGLLMFSAACSSAGQGSQDIPGTQDTQNTQDSSDTQDTPEGESLYQAGTYQGTSSGRNGDVTVEVTVSESQIESIVIVSQEESAGIADGALEEIPQRIMEAQSAEVEAVSGATITSEAIIKAVAQALRQAAGETEVVTERNTEADVIVIGAGASGLAAASSAVEAGAEVIVLEVNSYAGGAALGAAGIIVKLDPKELATQDRNDADLEVYSGYDAEMFPEGWREDFETLLNQIAEYTSNQEETGKFGSIERIMVNHYLKGFGTDLDGTEVSLDYDLIRNAMEHNMEIYNWLADNGLTFQERGPMDYTAIPNERGAELVEALKNAADGAEIQYGVRATQLILKDGRVTGVLAVDENGNEITYTAKSGVVLATGGYASNTEMVARYQRVGTGLNANTPSNDPASIQGDGIIMAEQIGAQLRDMSFITTRMMGYQNGCTTDEAGAVFKAAQLAVNAQSDRFADDSNSNKVIAAAGNEEDGVLYVIGDAKMINALEEAAAGRSADLAARGIAWQGESLEDVIKAAGLDVEKTMQTIETFNSYADAEKDPDFGRESYNGKVEEGPYYIAKLQIAYHLTFGGLVIDTDTHVLDTDGNIIPGLYAGGDVISGYEGVVHQGGNCLTVVLNTGRTAGTMAAKGDR